MAPEGTPDGTGFGFYEMPLDEEDFSEIENQEPEAPVEVPEADAPEQDDEPDAEPEAIPEEGAPAEEGDADDTSEELLAGKYQSVEELERGYAEQVQWATRMAQQQAEQARKLEEQQQLLTQLLPLVNQWRAEQDPEFAEQLEEMQRLQPLVESQVAPMRAQMEQERSMMALVQTVSEFRARHPDVPANSPADHELRGALDSLGIPPEQYQAQHLEAAYQMIQDPSFARVMRHNPHLVSSEEGLAYAQDQARLLNQAQAPVRQKAVAAAPRGDDAFVETGGSGAPAAPPGSQQGDEFDAALKAWQTERNSPLFG